MINITDSDGKVIVNIVDLQLYHGLSKCTVVMHFGIEGRKEREEGEEGRGGGEERRRREGGEEEGRKEGRRGVVLASAYYGTTIQL